MEGDKRAEALRRILRYQFDLEILLRLREKKLIEMEMNKGKLVRETIEYAIINDYIHLLHPDLASPEAISFERPTLVQIRDLEALAENGAPYGHLMAGVRSASTQHQYETKPDGSVVKLRCPVCEADKFKSILGFLNHCRINCKVIFASPEDRQTRAGVPVDANEVPPDAFMTKHPSLVKQEKDLAIIRSEVQTTQPDFNKLPEIKEHLDEFPIVQLADDDTVVSSTKDEQQVGAATELTFDDEGSGSGTGRFYIHKEIIIGNDATCVLASTALTPQMTAKVVTHKWKIYVRSGDYYSKKGKPSTSILEDDMSRWLKAVRFHLHPSYKPSVVEVTRPPFQLELDAYGEFPVRVELLFWDEARNKALQFVHHMRIFMATRTSRVTPGPERLYTIDLDRETDYSLFKPAFPLPDPPNVVLEFGDASLDSKHTTVQKDDYELLKEVYSPTDPISDLTAAEIRSNIRLANPEFSLTTEEIRQWLKGRQESHDQLLQDISSLMYCRYCGVPHQPQDRFETIQKNCSHKPRKIRFITRSSVSNLFERAAIPQGPKGEPVSFDFPECRWLEPQSPAIVEADPDLSLFPQVELISLVVAPNSMELDAMATLSGAAVAFLKRLLSLSLANLEGRDKQETELESQCLTAWHVYKTIVDPSNDFSFLTNAHLSS